MLKCFFFHCNAQKWLIRLFDSSWSLFFHSIVKVTININTFQCETSVSNTFLGKILIPSSSRMWHHKCSVFVTATLSHVLYGVSLRRSLPCLHPHLPQIVIRDFIRCQSNTQSSFITSAESLFWKKNTIGFSMLSTTAIITVGRNARRLYEMKTVFPTMMLRFLLCVF